MNKSFKFLDLFCGCGGLSYGLEMAGHTCLLGVDANKAATDSFAANHPHAKVFCGDIKTLNKKTLKGLLQGQQIDMVVGGPPCQGFSTVGRGKVEDERNQLFKEFVRIVEITKPKVIIFENVTGMVAKKNAAILAEVFKYFTDLGFIMEAKVLSSEEFGVPEKRRRTIIMGVRKGECRFPKPSHGVRGLKAPLTVKEAFKNLKASNGEIFNHDTKKALLASKLDTRRLEHIEAGCGIRYPEDDKKLPAPLRYKINWKTLREGRFRQTKLQRLPWNLPAPTILTSRTSYYHPIEARYLTSREAAACQSFPNDFIFKGSETAIFRQIGNAVPPLLAKALGEEIKKIRFGVVKMKKKTHPLVFKNPFDYQVLTSI